MNYLQDCSTFQSEDLKLGISYLNEEKLFYNIVWMSWHQKNLPRTKSAQSVEYLLLRSGVDILFHHTAHDDR